MLETNLNRNQDPSECLFSDEHVKQIKANYQDWFENSLRDVDRESEGKYFTHSGIPIKLIYTPADIEHLSYTEDICFSGHPPYLRGVYPNMYRGRFFNRPPAGRSGRTGRL